jgi:hypothetical protein
MGDVPGVNKAGTLWEVRTDYRRVLPADDADGWHFVRPTEVLQKQGRLAFRGDSNRRNKGDR